MSVGRIDPGTVVAGRYRVEAQIGMGGMAIVYRAEDIQLGRKVALKVLHHQYAEDREFIERFRREAKAAARLQHPGVVAVYDTGSWEGIYFIAMELLEGQTLKDTLVQGGRLSSPEAIDLTMQILRAVRAAHRDGIVHRDLKPHNVMLDKDGRAKVMDFGIARLGASDMTATGSILGTAHYIAPEQAQGDVVTPRTDLYAIGVMLYEMLTAQTPFTGDSAVSIAMAHVNNEPKSPRSLEPSISPALDHVVLRALAKRPADRFPDADAFIAALADARRGISPIVPPVTGQHATTATPYVAPAAAVATPATPPPDKRPWYQRTWVIALGALAVVGIVIAVLLLGRTQQVFVPDVTGADTSTATDRLQKDGFQVSQLLTRSNAPTNTVIKQNPVGGVQVNKHSVVTITVSGGPGTATVPQVNDQSVADALDLLKTAGFKASQVKQANATVAKGTVIESSPPAGSIAPSGSTVQLTVSSGPKKVVIPDLVNQPYDTASQTLTGLGLTVQKNSVVDDTVEVGTVLSTNPAAGAKVATGTAVQVTVAKGPDKVELPDVTGETSGDAKQQLQALKFKVTTVSEAVTDSSQDGLVQDQSPKSGSNQPQGTTVQIVVGKFTAPPSTPGSTP